VERSKEKKVMSAWIQDQRREKIRLIDVDDIDTFYCPHCSNQIDALEQSYLNTVWEYCWVTIPTGDEEDWESGEVVNSDPQSPTCPDCHAEVSLDEVIEHSKDVYLSMMESMESDLDDEP
jgi:hypothetical protein